jgi:hypothetical protein
MTALGPGTDIHPPNTPLPVEIGRLQMAFCVMRRVHDSIADKKEGPPGVEARRPFTTAWCDQISTPAENQPRFLFGTHLCP